MTIVATYIVHDCIFHRVVNFFVYVLLYNFLELLNDKRYELFIKINLRLMFFLVVSERKINVLTNVIKNINI